MEGVLNFVKFHEFNNRLLQTTTIWGILSILHGILNTMSEFSTGYQSLMNLICQYMYVWCHTFVFSNYWSAAKESAGCRHGPCQNGGLCLHAELRGVPLYQCQCPAAYTGQYCELGKDAQPSSYTPTDTNVCSTACRSTWRA